MIYLFKSKTHEYFVSTKYIFLNDNHSISCVQSFPGVQKEKKNMEKKSSLIAQLYIFFKKIWLKKRKFQYTKFNIYFIDFFLKNKIFIPINKNIPNRSHFCKDILHQINPHIIWRRNELYCVLVNEQDTCVLIMSLTIEVTAHLLFLFWNKGIS